MHLGSWCLGFREENHERMIEALERRILVMESKQEREDAVFDFMLVFAEENWSETVRTWAGVCVHS